MVGRLENYVERQELAAAVTYANRLIQWLAEKQKERSGDLFSFLLFLFSEEERMPGFCNT